MAATSDKLHDIPGVHRAWVHVGAYSGSTDNAKRDMLMVAPWTMKVKSVKAYFQGTANVVGGTATDYFTYTVYAGTVAFGTAGPSGTIGFGTPLTVFSGTQSVASGAALYVEYGTAGGTAALDAPRALFEIQYEGA